MARLGRFDKFVQDPSGNGLAGVSVEVRKRGATINGDQSGTTPLTITVNSPGLITSSDNVVIGTGTTTFAVDSVTATTVVVSGFVGTLNVSDDDRISATTSLPSLFNDHLGAEILTNPLTSAASTGQVAAWLNPGFYDIHISGGAATTTLQQDTQITADNVFNVLSFGATGDGTTDDSASVQLAIDSLPSTGGTIFFPTGRYNIVTGISTDKNGVRLTGTGPQTYNEDPTSGSVLVTGTSSMTMLSFDGSTVVRHLGPTIE